MSGFMAPAVSTLTLNTSSFPIGDHVINCLAAVDGIDLQAVNASVSINVGEHMLQNITVTDNVGGQILLSDLQVGELVLTCTVESSMEPNIEWTRNNLSVSGTPPTLIMATNSNNTYSSMLVLNESDLMVPTEEFQCFASLDILGLNSLEASRSILVDAVFVNVNISPMETLVNNTGNEILVNLTCNVEAILIPVVLWSQDGVAVTETTVRTSMSGRQFIVESDLVVNATLLVGPVNFTCTVSPMDTRFNGSVPAMAIITTNGKLVVRS